ncbi:Uncharacterized conserved protein YbjQ, UPF0145 family [Chitinophaga jiangningensis]|uniref:UPF0145 protein SAMN05444266_106160 n=1 Tax=Chitinophaga jiangningensis TaxID=1419482 RepID=A0A1M7FIP6_9BACT|nr:YbjQ family protein [Chitinophaga jiangningensis]SHM03992.1 Uncharacterized conserved protein YbjQ, UPF0145 family [Chitinophaga jiangningensis]
MRNSKDILVTTTSTLEGITIKRYLKPITAHVVAGTNIFSDFIASLTDVFGGRSRNYQRQLTSLYDEATELIRAAAYELGANCVIGLKIDMDEISGKGKSMFMITAIGTAVIIDRPDEYLATGKTFERQANVDLETLNTLKIRNSILKDAMSDNLKMGADTWQFITNHQIHELYPYLLKKLAESIDSDERSIEAKTPEFIKLLIHYLDGMPKNIQHGLVSSSLLHEENHKIIPPLMDVAKTLNIIDYDLINTMISSPDFDIQKRGVKLATYDKESYNKDDLQKLKDLSNKISNSFPEQGKRTIKKQLLSKEREVWICGCGQTAEMNAYCECGKNIYGFKQLDVQPQTAEKQIQEKIGLISNFFNS